MSRAVFIHSEALEAYHYPEGNPLSTDRAGMTYRMARSMGLLSGSGRSVAGTSILLDARGIRHWLAAPAHSGQAVVTPSPATV